MTERASDAAGTGLACGFPRALTWAVVLTLPGPIFAQDAPGGRQITFGIDSRLIAQQNANLAPGGKVRTAESNTRLSLGLRSETPASFVALDASGRLRFVGRVGSGATGQRNALTDPSITLSFGSEAAASSIAGSAFLRETDLSQDATIDPFLPPVGTQRRVGGNLSYRWGENRRVSFGLSAGFADTTYRDAPGQTDNRRLDLGGDVRLDLTEVAQLTFGVSRSGFAPAGGAARETAAFTTDLVIDRPRGPVTISAAVTDTPDGTRTALSVGRRLELPDGIIAAKVGVTRGVTGKFGVTGELGYSRDLPDGRISLALSRSVLANEDDAEVTQTRASLGFGRELTDRTRLLVELGLGESRASGTGTDIRSGTFAVILSQDLDTNWALDAGYQLRARRVTGQASATNGAIFIGLRRQFVATY